MQPIGPEDGLGEVIGTVARVDEHFLLGRPLLLAVGAQPASEPLREHAVHRRGDEERLDAHLDETRDGAGGVVGVQRREHEVAGERGLDGDLRGLLVANLADEDDVGRAAQERAERSGERQARLVLIWHWLTPGSRYSTGSSAVMMWRAGSFSTLIAA